MALTDKLTAIGDAIREKTGGTEPLTLDQMATEIASISTGSGGEVEPIVLSGDCQYACSGIIANIYVEKFGNTISTSGITNAPNMFYSSLFKRIPFELNFNPSSAQQLRDMFSYSQYLEEVPVMNNVYPITIANLFTNCNCLRKLPDNFGIDWNWDYAHTKNTSNLSAIFNSCYSLRSIPESFLNNLWNMATSLVYSQFYSGFANCYTLDEIKGLKFSQSTMTSNMFNNPFSRCYRLKDILFSLNGDGSVQTVNCKSQTIDLTTYVGYCESWMTTAITTAYNSGITENKFVKDDATYQALKDDPDWFSANINYSRYNHDSAVRTINSLPDTSAYLATAGGTNTIKFKGASGSKTDGGAINTLTEEEIAVATAKGWTVSLV